MADGLVNVPSLNLAVVYAWQCGLGQKGESVNLQDKSKFSFVSNPEEESFGLKSAGGPGILR